MQQGGQVKRSCRGAAGASRSLISWSAGFASRLTGCAASCPAFGYSCWQWPPSRRPRPRRGWRPTSWAPNSPAAAARLLVVPDCASARCSFCPWRWLSPSSSGVRFAISPRRWSFACPAAPRPRSQTCSRAPLPPGSTDAIVVAPRGRPHRPDPCCRRTWSAAWPPGVGVYWARAMPSGRAIGVCDRWLATELHTTFVSILIALLASRAIGPSPSGMARASTSLRPPARDIAAAPRRGPGSDRDPAASAGWPGSRSRCAVATQGGHSMWSCSTGTSRRSARSTGCTAGSGRDRCPRNAPLSVGRTVERQHATADAGVPTPRLRALVRVAEAAVLAYDCEGTALAQRNPGYTDANQVHLDGDPAARAPCRAPRLTGRPHRVHGRRPGHAARPR